MVVHGRAQGHADALVARSDTIALRVPVPSVTWANPAPCTAPFSAAATAAALVGRHSAPAIDRRAASDSAQTVITSGAAQLIVLQMTEASWRARA